MPKRPEDRYTNLASAVVTEAAAGTTEYTELLTGISLGQGMGILIDSISYVVPIATLALLVAVADRITMGWTVSDVPTSLDYSDRRLLDFVSLSTEPVIGTPASAGTPVEMPIVHQFFPPMIVANPRLYLACQGVSLSAAVTIASRIAFRYIELTPVEYLELAETFILVG